MLRQSPMSEEEKFITKLVEGVLETGCGWWLSNNNASVFTEVNI